VRSTQKTPFSTARVSCHGRPRPSARRLGRNNGKGPCSRFTPFVISFNRSGLNVFV